MREMLQPTPPRPPGFRNLTSERAPLLARGPCHRRRYNNVCGATKKSGEILSLIGKIPYIGVPFRYLAKLFTGAFPPAGTGAARLHDP